jgi:ferredoxin
MIGNNSCGVHGLLGGKVVDNVESLDIVLYDGTRMTVGAPARTPRSAHPRRRPRGPNLRRPRAHPRPLRRLIREKFPRIPRRVSGYNLDELLPENNFNVARALVGSEGTCANVVSATLNLTASPPFRVLTVLGFDDPSSPPTRSRSPSSLGPSAWKAFDHLLVDFMRRKGLALATLDQLPGRRAFCWSKWARGPLKKLAPRPSPISRSQSWPSPPVAHICTPDEAAACGSVRESALGAMVFVPGEPDRWEGWEDAAVPPAQARQLSARITALMAEYGFRSPLYGHYGQGCVHMRINFDFRSPRAFAIFREFIERAAEVVLSFGGSLSGEHGDGQARAALLPKMFGPELIEAFREFKALWDPDNRMNPGKLVDAVRVYDPVENLRQRASRWVPQVPRPANGGKTLGNALRFRRRQRLSRSAPPSAASAWAPAATPWAASCAPATAPPARSSTPPAAARTCCGRCWPARCARKASKSRAVHEALDLCLSCKACKSECPVQVDMAAYKSEFLAQRYKGRLHPLHHYIFGFADRLARYGSLAPALTNAIFTGPLTSPLIKRIAGVAASASCRAWRRRAFKSPDQRPANRDESHKSRPKLRPTAGGPKVCRTAGGALARHLEQLLPPAIAFRRRSRPHAKPASGRNPRGPHLLRPSALRFRPARRGPLLSRRVLDRMARKSRPACPSSFSSQAAPASSKTSCSSSFPTIPAPNA